MIGKKKVIPVCSKQTVFFSQKETFLLFSVSNACLGVESSRIYYLPNNSVLLLVYVLKCNCHCHLSLSHSIDTDVWVFHEKTFYIFFLPIYVFVTLLVEFDKV